MAAITTQIYAPDPLNIRTFLTECFLLVMKMWSIRTTYPERLKSCILGWFVYLPLVSFVFYLSTCHKLLFSFTADAYTSSQVSIYCFNITLLKLMTRIAPCKFLISDFSLIFHLGLLPQLLSSPTISGILPASFYLFVFSLQSLFSFFY